ncbi:MAG TPA: hypothetical protein VN238_17600 [Solirubrobacteraceae bacterium]|nr:hypothetical protein [Solirubrobacteraceae bacterium]
MRRSSVFSRVTKYVPTDAVDPGEDRLTEVTAAVLERVGGLARTLALRWLDPGRVAGRERATSLTADACGVIARLPPDAAVTVRTQVRAAARIVDLELRFHESHSTSPTAAVVWVEVKHGTSPHTGQLHDYVKLRPDHPGAVVLLAPRPDLPAPEREVPTAVPQRSWQATAAQAATFKVGDAVQRFLVDEWIAYLQEENLMDLDALGPEHLTALAYGAEAREALTVVVEAASDLLVQARGTCNDERRRGSRAHYGVGYWQTWPLDLSEEGDAWDGAWLDWKLDQSRGGDLGVPAGRVFVMAGLSKPRGGEFTSDDHDWRERLTSGLRRGDERVTLRRWRGDHERLQRVALPHEVLRGGTLAEQGESLGGWVASTFAAIEEHGPPMKRG